MRRFETRSAAFLKTRRETRFVPGFHSETSVAVAPGGFSTLYAPASGCRDNHRLRMAVRRCSRPSRGNSKRGDELEDRLAAAMQLLIPSLRLRAVPQLGAVQYGFVVVAGAIAFAVLLVARARGRDRREIAMDCANTSGASVGHSTWAGNPAGGSHGLGTAVVTLYCLLENSRRGIRPDRTAKRPKRHFRCRLLLKTVLLKCRHLIPDRSDAIG